jgi:DnaD/phage-associated family protein
MAWIESHQSLARHAKLIRAAATLRVSRPLLIGHLHLLWWWAVDQADGEGNLGDVSPAVIALGSEWPEAKAEDFVNALVDARFLDVVEDGYRLHNWDLYGGRLQARREGNRDRMRAKRRAAKEAADSAPFASSAQSVQRTTRTRVQPVQGLHNTTQHDTTRHDTTVPVVVTDDGAHERDDDDGLSPLDLEIGSLCTFWTERTGATTNPAISDSMRTMLDEGVDLEWIRAAIEMTATANVRRWSYTAKIVERWRTQGFRDDGAKDSSNGGPGDTLEERKRRYGSGPLAQFVNTGFRRA